MGQYRRLMQLLHEKRLPVNVSPISEDRLSQLRAKYPGLPGEYYAFLSEVGFGSLGDGGYMIYNGLLSPSELYGFDSAGIDDLLLFGDDFHGYAGGFRPHEKWAVFELDSSTLVATYAAISFADFIDRKIHELLPN